MIPRAVDRCLGVEGPCPAAPPSSVAVFLLGLSGRNEHDATRAGAIGPAEGVVVVTRRRRRLTTTARAYDALDGVVTAVAGRDARAPASASGAGRARFVALRPLGFFFSRTRLHPGSRAEC